MGLDLGATVRRDDRRSTRPTLPYGGVPGLVVPPNYAVYLSQTRREVGVVGLVLTLIGAALVVVSFAALDWLSGDDGFGDI